MLHLIQLLTPIAKCLLNCYTHWYSWGIKRLVYPINTFDCSFTITWAMKNQAKKIYKDIIIDFLSLKYSINLRHSSYRIESTTEMETFVRNVFSSTSRSLNTINNNYVLLIKDTNRFCKLHKTKWIFYVLYTHNFHQP